MYQDVSKAIAWKRHRCRGLLGGAHATPLALGRETPVIVVVMAIPPSGFVKWLMAIDYLFGSGIATAGRDQ